MQNVDVRRALALAIDKDALVTAVGSSEYYKVLNGYIPEGLAGAEGRLPFGGRRKGKIFGI